ncbi:triokinase/FMN cyclase, partial [Anabrus simplex]|uniref:triokinase/FMN cyclase n=1 Tax=Anabrus simplex TaxID=316456 RepID=UPI0035A37846
LLENERIIMRRDHTQMEGKVKLISGGGSGHEPAHAGFVGPGMLTAAVLGDVFTAPPSNTILRTIRELGHEHLPGVLLIVKNYTGDRLNFGVAMERARNEGINVKMLIVGEDCALPETGKMEGRRGLAGTILVHKLAGAMAEEGLSLEEIFSACRTMTMTDMGTITVGLTPPNMTDTSLKSLGLQDDELELGLGIHGEPGVHRVPMGTAAEIVHIMLEHMINPASKSHIHLDKDTPIALLINNMGGSSKLEENVFAMETIRQFVKSGYKVLRVYCGTFLTSLEMPGFSITAFKLTSPDIIRYLDAPTMAPGWPRTLCAACLTEEPDTEPGLGMDELPLRISGWCPHTEDEKERKLMLSLGPRISDKSAQSVLQVLNFVADALIACEKQLNIYDSEGGDSDCGTTLRKGSEGIKAAIKSGQLDSSRPFAMLESLSTIMENTMGGTSGALYSIFFAAAAKPFQIVSEDTPVDARLWLEALRQGTKAVMRYGRAEVRDRTMVDPLHAAIEAMTESLSNEPENGMQALVKATRAARASAEETRSMQPLVGKASLSPQKHSEQPDPGAYAVSIWFHAVNESVKLLFSAMNAVIAMCHFCELHGPSILFTTQAFHDSEAVDGERRKSHYGNLDGLKSRVKGNTTDACEACQSLNNKHLGYISNDHEGRITYLSTQQPVETDVATMVRQACFRSLSCEVSPGKEGPVFFGDDVRGHVASHTFFLKDAQARGFHRWFSILILMRDKLFLLNSWPFLVEHLKNLVTELQAKSTKVYDREQEQCPQRALRLNADSSLYKQQAVGKTSRSLVDLTADTHVFAQLHWRFSWLLKVGASRLVEQVAQASWDNYRYEVAELEEGFTLVSATDDHSPVHELEASGSCDVDDVAPAVSNIRHLYQIVGRQQFIALAYNLMVGHQVVVRGQPRQLVASIIACLKVVVPRPCYRAVMFSDEYLDNSHCNLLGLEPWVAAPQLNTGVVRLDILPPDDKTRLQDLHSYSYKLTWGGKLPLKCPTVLLKMERALDNLRLSDTVIHYHFVALKEEWLNIAKVLRRVQQIPGQQQDLTSLLQALGAQEQDKPLLDFWASHAP